MSKDKINWCKVKPIDREATFKKVEILSNALLWLYKDIPLKYSLDLIERCCRLTHQTMWWWLLKSNDRLKSDFITTRNIEAATKEKVPGACYMCLWASIKAKSRTGDRQESCEYCDFQERLDCNNEFGLFRSFIYCKDLKEKKLMGSIIRDMWE